mgnify:CR=1 FL=1
MRMILIYNIVKMNKNITLNHKNPKYIENYVRGLTEDLDDMADKMKKKQLDVEDYQQWFSLICSALNLIESKSEKDNLKI